MATKRSAAESSSSAGNNGGPPAKKSKTLYQFQPVNIGAVFGQEELDMKVLQFQNKKLVERIEQRRKAEAELRNRIEELELRQTTDDAVMCIVNRHWNQLDEDVRVLLQRFDAESADESAKENESPAVTAFLTLLSQLNESEISDKLTQRVEFSKRAIGKLLLAYDRQHQRYEKLWKEIKEKADEEEKIKEEGKTKAEEVKEEEKEAASDAECKTEVKEEDEKDGEKKEETVEVKKEVVEETKKTTDFSLDSAVREEMERLVKENKRLHDLATEMQQKYHSVNLSNAELQDRVHSLETSTAELKNQTEELRYDLNIANGKIGKMDVHLAEMQNKISLYTEENVKLEGGQDGVSKNKYTEVASELEEQREMATNRLSELERLQKLHEEATKEIEMLKMKLSTLPEEVIRETTEYKCLQSQFSVLYNESLQLLSKLDEKQNHLSNCKTAHLRQIEQMETDEFSNQRTQRKEMIALEDQMAQVRREYEMLRIEFEQTLAANEQTGPINREMRNLISSLRQHNEQVKGELQRFKRKVKDNNVEIAKLKSEVETFEKEREKHLYMGGEFSELLGTSSAEGQGRENTESGSGDGGETVKTDAEIIRDLRAELKRALDSQKELKLLLDMYKSAPKDVRDKVMLMASEKKLKTECEETKHQLKRLQDVCLEELRRPADQETQRKVKKLEESNTELSRQLTAQKQEEEALLSEVEVTGNAFEDMQEQNIRLLQQLREKDDANFKLMSERIKFGQLQRLMREESAVLEEQVHTLRSQVEAEAKVVRKLEEKEHLLETRLATSEKELVLRQQMVESQKRKALESTQTAADLKLHLDKYHTQLKEAQVAVQEKTAALQSQSFKYKRLQEEVASLRKKLEQVKKIEMASSADEVLQEEIREYKEQLTCPSCKVKKKDAILSKCFHVFCFDCLKRRYETRQRKCPKCNATFGANDYHRIYLE